MLRILARFLTVAVLAAPAFAGEVADKAAQAEALAAEGKYVEAIAALDQATGALWDKAPLTFRKALWVPSEPAGFGAYKVRANDRFYPGNSMIAYAEPVGFGWRQFDDVFITDLAADIAIKSKDGTELYSQKDFQKLQITSRTHNREFMTFFTYTLTGIPPGEYVIDTTLRDAVTGKSGTFSLPFVILKSAADSP